MNTIRFLCTLTLGAVLTGATRADTPTESLPPGAKLVRIEATPKAVALKHAFDYRQLVLTGVLASGEKIDVTRQAKLDQPSPLVKVSPTGLVRPAADGKGQLKFGLAGQSVTVPVTVGGQKAKYQVSFIRDVMPVLAKAGCNAGTCHGGQQGKGGFQLSLRGYDPVFDHRALTDDVSGRRFNRAAPDQSLMLLKPSGAVAHVGGVVFQPGEPYYELLRSWIADGVKLDVKPRVSKLEVLPQNPVVPLPQMKQQMIVLATYPDGSVRDVTAEAIIESSSTEIATADKAGLLTAVRRGETAVMVRYEGAYTATPLIVMGDRSGYAWKPTTQYNYIDSLVYDKLRQVKILPSDVCTDSEFIRRIYLDLTGLPPEPADVRAFLKDPQPSRAKRDALVDKLVGGSDYVDHWTNKWADLLQVNRNFLGHKGATALRDWIRKAVADNMPYNSFAHAILTASGSNVDNPPAAYYKILRDPTAAMENTTHLFLAVRFNCNKCHDHPFERWTQGQYYHLSAYFAQVDRRPDPRYKGQTIGGSAVMGKLPLVEVIGDGKGGDVKNLRTGAVAEPSFPFTHRDLAPTSASRREQLARWITSKENPYFAKSYVNRVWSYLLGVGVIEPIDDIRAGNPPTNPQLLDRLASEFVKSGFDVQALIKTICKSRTYQHSIVTNRWNRDDNVNYSHALARRLPAEVLFDAIHRATGAPSRLQGQPVGIRAAQLLDSNVKVPGDFLKLLGQPPRESACECERSSGSMLLGPVLALINGPIPQQALSDPTNRIHKLVATEKDDARVIDELFLAILCREPTAEERAKLKNALQSGKEDFELLRQAHAEKLKALADYEKVMDARQAAWEQKLKNVATWTVLDPDTFTASGGTTLKKLPDRSILASGKNPTPETYTITAKTTLTGITAVRLEAMTDTSLPARGPGRAQNGNFVLSEFKLSATPLDPKVKAKAGPIALRNPQATFAQEGFPIKNAIDNNPNTGWAISTQFGKPQVAVFETKGKIGSKGGTKLTFTLQHLFNGKLHNLGRVRLSVTTMTPPVPLAGVPDNIAKILGTPAEQRSAAEKAALSGYFRSTDAELKRLQEALAAVPVPPDARTLAAQDLASALMNTPEFLFNH